MRKVLISVEGQTEETFVRDVLSQHLGGLCLYPVIVKTRRTPGGSYRGGHVPYGRIRKELLNLLGDSSAAAVTTMYDLYALPEDFPGYAGAQQATGLARARYLEQSLADDIGQRRFCPHLQVHEFEALLFSDIERTCALLGGDAIRLAELAAIKKAFPSPEEIDDCVETAPARRIERLFPSYQKVLDGSRIVQRIGLERLRKECSHFDEWVTWLESMTS